MTCPSCAAPILGVVRVSRLGVVVAMHCDCSELEDIVPAHALRVLGSATLKAKRLKVILIKRETTWGAVPQGPLSFRVT